MLSVQPIFGKGGKFSSHLAGERFGSKKRRCQHTSSFHTNKVEHIAVLCWEGISSFLEVDQFYSFQLQILFHRFGKSLEALTIARKPLSYIQNET